MLQIPLAQRLRRHTDLARDRHDRPAAAAIQLDRLALELRRIRPPPLVAPSHDGHPPAGPRRTQRSSVRQTGGTPCCRARAGGWRRSWPAGDRGPEPRQRGGALEPPAIRAPRPEVTAPASRKGSRGSACTVLVASMPRTPPTTKASRPRRPPHAARYRRRSPRATTSSERSRRPNACSSTTTRAITETIERANGHRGTKSLTKAIASDPQWTRGELGAPHAQARPRPRPAAARAATTPSMPPTTQVSRPTSTSRRTAWSSRPTAGTPTAPARPSRTDRAKDAALTAAGYTVVRFTWRQLRDDPQTVADRLKAIIGATSAPAPPGTPRARAPRSSSRARAPGSGRCGRRRRRRRRPRPSRPAGTRSA